MSYRSCPGCGFLVGLEADRCPLCSRPIGAEDDQCEEPPVGPTGELLPPDPATAVWPPRPAPDALSPDDEATDLPTPPGAQRDSPAVPLAVAVLAVLAMVGLTFFGHEDRSARALGPSVTLPDPDAVAATLPTTIPPGWITYTDPAGAFLAPMPATPAPSDELDPDGRTVHRLAATGADASLVLSWVEIPEVPWTGPDATPWLEAAARAVIPEGAQVTTVTPSTVAGAAAVEVRYVGADGVAGVVGAVGHAQRLYRISALAPTPDAALVAFQRVGAGFVLP